MRSPHLSRHRLGRAARGVRRPEARLAQRYWTVNGLGDHSEVYSETRRTWVKASKQVVTPAGLVEATVSTQSVERVTLRVSPREIWLVR